MNQDFVPYELALKLKQLGFNYPCLFAWCNRGGWNKYTGEREPLTQVLRTDGNPFGDFFEGKNWNIEVVHNNKNNIQCSAPTFQQAFRWFRDEHGSLNHLDFMYEYLKDDSISYEEAEIACLEKLIEIVKLKQP
jgi:hypothetical protein